MNPTIGIFEQTHNDFFGAYRKIAKTPGPNAYEKPREYHLNVIEIYHRCGDAYYIWLEDSEMRLYMISCSTRPTSFVAAGDSIQVTAKRKRVGTLGGSRYTQLWYAMFNGYFDSSNQ